MCVWGGTFYVSVGKDVPPKGVQFSESVLDNGNSIVQILGRGSNMPVWKGPLPVWRGIV